MLSVYDFDSEASLISATPYCRIYRIRREGRSCVLKQFTDPQTARETDCYALLRQYGVLTLPVHAQFSNAIVLEDLEESVAWRCATEEDVQREDVGVAVAQWYRIFHDAGFRCLKGKVEPPAFLTREIDQLTPAAILDTGGKLGLATCPVWRLAAEHIDAITATMRSLPQTFNYNDFYWGNLALPRDSGKPLSAIVFDYHLMGVGLAYSDCRNVVGSLGNLAQAAFWRTYGPTNAREAVLDAPSSVLYALIEAVSRPQWPSWADPLVERARTGALEADIKKAVKILQCER